MEQNNERLIEAAKDGDVQTLRALIDAGADVNAKGYLGMTALMQAATRGHVECAKILLNAGANVNAVNELGRKALKMAEESGNLEILKLLTEADPLAPGIEVCFPNAEIKKYVNFDALSEEIIQGKVKKDFKARLITQSNSKPEEKEWSTVEKIEGALSMRGLCIRALAVVGIVIASYFLLVLLVVTVMGDRGIVWSYFTSNPRPGTVISIHVIAVLAVVGALIVPALRGVRTLAAMAAFGLGLALTTAGGSLLGRTGLGSALVTGLISFLACAALVAHSGKLDSCLSKGIALAVLISVVLDIGLFDSMSGYPWLHYPSAVLLLLPIGLVVPSLLLIALKSASYFSASRNSPTKRSTIGMGVLFMFALTFGLSMASPSYEVVLVFGVAMCIWPAVYGARLEGADASSHQDWRTAILVVTAAVPYVVAVL